MGSPVGYLASHVLNPKECSLSFPFSSFPLLSFPFLSFPFLSFPFLPFPSLSFPSLSFFISATSWQAEMTDWWGVQAADGGSGAAALQAHLDSAMQAGLIQMNGVGPSGADMGGPGDPARDGGQSAGILRPNAEPYTAMQSLNLV